LLKKSLDHRLQIAAFSRHHNAPLLRQLSVFFVRSSFRAIKDTSSIIVSIRPNDLGIMPISTTMVNDATQ